VLFLFSYPTLESRVDLKIEIQGEKPSRTIVLREKGPGKIPVKKLLKNVIM